MSGTMATTEYSTGSIVSQDYSTNTTSSTETTTTTVVTENIWNSDTENNTTTTTRTTASNPISQANTVWNVKEEQEISAQNKRLITKYLKRNHIELSKEEVQQATNLLKQSSDKLGIDLNELSEEEKIFYAGLLIEMNRGNLTADEVMAITAEYGNDAVKAKVKELHLENGGGVDEAKINRYKEAIGKLAKMHSAMAFSSARQIYGENEEETKKLREEFLLKQQKAAEARAEAQMKAAADALPENCTKEDAQKIIEATGMVYGKTSTSSFVTLAKAFNYSANLVSKLSAIAQKITETLQNKVAKIIEWFFKTPRGRMLKESYISHKKAFKETVDVAKVKQEEAKAAEKKANEAVEAAEAMKKKANQIIANLGFKNLNEEQSNKLLKSKSFTNWRALEDAKDAKKKAYWEAYDANSAKRLAENDCKLAFFNLAIVKTQILNAIRHVM